MENNADFKQELERISKRIETERNLDPIVLMEEKIDVGSYLEGLDFALDILREENVFTAEH